MSHSKPFVLYLYLQVFIAESHWPGSRPLVSVRLSMLGLTGTLLGYPVVALGHGGPAVLGLQVQPLHMLPQITDEMDGGPTQNPGSGPG